MMKQKLTIRLDEEVYRKLYFYANERKISVNKLVASMIDRCIDVPRDADFFGNVMSCLKSLDKKIETISKRQYLHFKVSKQHFANFGYLSNAAIDEDKCLNQLLNTNKYFND